jgi:dTDP-4-dehydrorhamnose reductase
VNSEADAAAVERPVLVLGAAGQLGRAMAATLGGRMPTIALTRADLDLRDGRAVRSRIADVRPRAIVNCAGFNHVDRAEKEPESALQDNGFAVLTLARAARDAGAALVHYSSDFVFDGTADRPYHENDRPAPQSVYAASKLLGEWFAAEAPAHYVLRVESLFGGMALRKSSLDKIIDAIATGRPVKAFADRVVSPSYVWDIVEATQALLERRPAAGTYHCVNAGAATWHELALEVQRLLGTTTAIEAVSVKDVVLPAARPQYCALSIDKLRDAGIAMPPWQEAIAREAAAVRERRTKN